MTFEAHERKRLYDRIQAHPGREANDRWDSLQRIHKVLQANEAELLRFIDAVQSDERIAMEVIRNVGQTGIGDRFSDELIRLLHNYLSAVKMLVDHTRNLVRLYEGTAFAEEYARRIKQMVASGRAPFLQKLRDYLIHYRIPPIGMVVHIGQASPFAATIFLDRDAALQYKDWPAPARRYLDAQPEQVPIRQLIAEYTADIKRVYKWMYNQFDILHGAEIDELNALVVQFQGAKNTPGHPDYQPPVLPSRG